jgi:hypothetical protein
VAHHTKDKGDLGVAKAHADLVSQGYVVLFPATEHAPFDLVAYRDGPTRNNQAMGVLVAASFRLMPSRVAP